MAQSNFIYSQFHEVTRFILYVRHHTSNVSNPNRVNGIWHRVICSIWWLYSKPLSKLHISSSTIINIILRVICINWKLQISFPLCISMLCDMGTHITGGLNISQILDSLCWLIHCLWCHWCLSYTGHFSGWSKINLSPPWNSSLTTSWPRVFSRMSKLATHWS